MPREVRIDQESLDTIFRNVSDAVVLVDRRRKVMALNPMAETLTGWRARDIDMLTCSVFNCRDENGKPLCADHCMALAAIESGQTRPWQNMTVNTAEGEPVPVEGMVVPIRSSEGRYTSVAMFLHDRTDVANYEQTIRDLSDELTEKNVVLRGLQQGLANAWKLPLVTIQSASLTLQGHFAANLGEGGLRHVKRVLTATQELESLFARLQAQVRVSVSSRRSSRVGPPDE